MLTASGGPFRTATLDEMRLATAGSRAAPSRVVDGGQDQHRLSATLMNKGLELIEAARLFAMDEAEIGVLVHPQSVVHGLVHYADGSVLAQLGAPDMRIPIAHTLAWPARLATESPRLDLAAVGRLEFCRAGRPALPGPAPGPRVLRAGGGAPTILSAGQRGGGRGLPAAADRLPGSPCSTVAAVLDELGAPPADTLEAVMGLDLRCPPRGRTCYGTAASRRPPEFSRVRISGITMHLLPDVVRTGLIAFVVVLGVLVFVHELGHYLAAASWRGRARGGVLHRVRPCHRAAGPTGTARSGSWPGCRWAAT